MEMIIDFASIDKENIKSKKYICDGIEYNIFNNKRNNTEESCSMFRSVITNESNKILCFAPPTLLETDKFFEKYPISSTNDDLLINELIEGTMINLFYDERISSWEISTRSILKANNWYYKMEYNNDHAYDHYKQKTFRQMFLHQFTMDHKDNINETFKLFPKNFCYSFVLQHPDNHIVLNLITPKVYLVAVYELLENNKVKFISPTDYESWSCFQDFREQHSYFPHFPSQYMDKLSTNTIDEIVKSVPMGIVLTNLKTGDRTMIINKLYEELKELRGNHVNLEYYYHVLRTQDMKNNACQLPKFVHYFPRYSGLFNEFNSKYNNLIKMVQNYYYEYYIKKNKTQIAKKYFIHVAKLHHEVYIPLKKIITLNIVKEYFDNMTPKEVYMYINYDEHYYDSFNKEPNNKKRLANERRDCNNIIKTVEDYI